MLHQVVVIEKLQIFTQMERLLLLWTSTGTEMEDVQYQLRRDNSGVDIVKVLLYRLVRCRINGLL